MIVITKDAEETFLRELDFLIERSSDRRCLYIRFSLLPTRKDDWFKTLTMALEDIADGHVGQVYICTDGDVFVVMPHLTEKHLHKFQAQYPELLSQPSLNICSLHEVKIDHGMLRGLCDRKLELLRAGSSDELAGRAAFDKEALRNTYLGTIDEDMRRGFNEKRERRNDIDIMIVDDDSLSRMMIKNVLVSDFNVHIAQTGTEAIERYFEIAPDIIFLDIGLPDMSGHEVLRAVLQIDPLAHIIMFSGRRDQDNVLSAINAGASGFVGKPFTRGKLYQYIDQCPGVQQKKARRLKLMNKA